MENKILDSPEIIEAINSNEFSKAAKLLFDQQYETWPLNKSNYDMLKNVIIKSFRFGSLKIRVQYNPGRITSTSAKVDEKSIREDL